MSLEISIMLIKIVLVLGCLLTVVPIMLFVERRGSALIQNRLGPNRIGPFGFFQTIADVIKFVMKEDRAPGHVNKFYWGLAPLLGVIPAFMTFAVIPFAGTFTWNGTVIHPVLADLDVGFLYIFSIASLGVYSIMMAGWASNNKFSLLGSLRASAQMISYELAMGLSVVGLIMIFQTVRLPEITAGQAETLITIAGVDIPRWGIFLQPVGFILFLISIFAETNRLPFDMAEGESELIAGYHLEYGAMRFALFMMAEYTNMAVGSALISTLFLGGWQLLPGMSSLIELIAQGDANLLLIFTVIFQAFSLILKIAFFMWLFVWVRWTLPRFRFDQLMSLGWKVLFPVALLNVLVTGLLIYKGVL